MGINLIPGRSVPELIAGRRNNNGSSYLKLHKTLILTWKVHITFVPQTINTQ